MVIPHILMHVCCWSGGEDSTATVILAHIHGEPLDEIIYTEVMFDKEKGVSGELPEHIYFVKHVAKPLFESWGYKVTVLQSDRDYLHCFHRIIEKPVKHMEHKGKQFGFPLVECGRCRCGIKRDCKIAPINRYMRTLGQKTIQYVGICANESARLASLDKEENKVSLLYKYGFTKAMTRQLCEDYGLRSPSYQYSNRGGCWFCPYAKEEEQRMVKACYPEAWDTFVSLEDVPNVANYKWSIFRRSLKEIDKML